MKRKWTILVDTREQTPLPIPANLTMQDPAWGGRMKLSTVRVDTVRTKLDEGDYALEGHRGLVLVERKASLREVAGNCLGRDRDRFVSCLDRLRSACSHPTLMLESTTLRRGHEAREMAGLDSLQRLCLERGISLLIMPVSTQPQRRLVGEWIARLLINGALTDGTPPDLHEGSPGTDVPV